MKNEIVEQQLYPIIKKSAILVGPTDLGVSSYLAENFKDVTWFTDSKICKHKYELVPIESAVTSAMKWKLHNKKVDCIFCNIPNQYVDAFVQLGLWMPNLRIGGIFVLSGPDTVTIMDAVERYMRGIMFVKYEVQVNTQNGLVFIKNRNTNE
jgi:hypothetical protein